MFIVVIAGRKGGCGKTTCATNLSAWLACQGHSVALLDTDPEHQAQTWHILRTAFDETVKVHLEAVTGDVRRSILSLSQEFDYVVVDTPGLDSIETKRAIAVAHVAVFPFKTSIFDLKTIPLANYLAEEIQAVRPEFVALAYASETYAGKSGEVDRVAALDALGKCSTLKLMDRYTTGRKAYRLSANEGRGVCEWTDAKAKEEFALLAQEVCSYVQA